MMSLFKRTLKLSLFFVWLFGVPQQVAASTPTPAQCFANPSLCSADKKKPAVRKKAVRKKKAATPDFIALGFKSYGAAERVQIQRSLKELGHYNSTLDGLYGRGTQRSIVEYLKSKGIVKYSKILIEQELSSLLDSHKDLEDFASTDLHSKSEVSQQAAVNLIADLEEYVASGSSDFNINFALEFGKVRPIKNGEWNESLLQKFKAFEKYLAREQGFVAFHKKRVEEREAAYTEELIDTRADLLAHITTLKTWAGQNLLDQRTERVIEKITQAEKESTKNNLKVLKSTSQLLATLKQSLGIQAKIVAPSPEETEAVKVLKSDLNKSRESALILVADLEEYVGSGRSDFDINFPLEFKKIRPIKKGQWNEALLQIFLTFKAYVLAEQGFAEYHEAKSYDREIAFSKQLLSDQEELMSNVGVLRSWVKSNLLDDAAAEAISLIASAEDAVSTSSSEQLKESLKKVKQKLSALNLNTKASLSENRNSPYVPDSIYLFGNYSGRAANIFKGLDSRPQIDGSIANICLSGTWDKWQRFAVFDYINDRFNAKEIVLLSNGCISASDLWVVTGAKIIESSLPSDFSTAYEKIEEFDRQATKTLKQRFELTSEIYEADVLKGLKKGFGILQLGKNSQKVCYAVGQGMENHVVAVQSNAEVNSLYAIDIDGAIAADNLLDAFRMVQKAECGFVYGDHSILAELIDASKNNRIGYELLPLWISNEAISSIADEKAEAARTRLSDAEARKQQQALAEQARQAANNKASVRQAQLQSQFGVRFASILDRLSNDLLVAVEFGLKHSPLDAGYQKAYEDTGLLDPVSGETSVYDSIIYEVQSLALKKWEKTGFLVEKVDYGSVSYNNRTVEGVIGQLKVNMKNRVIGDFQEYCRKIRAVYDDDFSMWRLIEIDDCDGIDAAWKLTTGFASKWIVASE